MSPPIVKSKKWFWAAIVVGGLFFLALVALMLYGVIRSGDADRDVLPSPLIGKPAPEFDLPILHDDTLSISDADLRGAPYLLNVWGSWCPSCRVEHPVITRFAETKRIRVIGYNWKDEHDDAMRWLEQFGNPYLLVLVDQDGRKALDWGVAAAPETFLVDSSGIIRWKFSGPLTDEVIHAQLLPILEQVERMQ
ncbi:MAG: DsbE family thiol:disulfide interchange protein [Xanthomonadaceae bacterium]|jgi:cytochrome c biogenesis protein CcmG/thiol:disulfide interchange protein DsbE|nr:DsbE family thiol:disulfide interchange protein [Xanthomonadaceae bacterium]